MNGEDKVVNLKTAYMGWWLGLLRIEQKGREEKLKISSNGCILERNANARKADGKMV